MIVQGTISKLRAEVKAPLAYVMPVGATQVPLQPGQHLRLRAMGSIRCLHCQRATRKSYNQGYCYVCFTKLAACDMCIMRPEQCHFAAGTCREPVWGEQHCMVPHVVYLANSSGVKVGITRQTQVPVRWIDQGASAALPLFQVGSRLHSGLIEVALAQHVADKTQWQAMLRGQPEPVDLVGRAEQLMQLCARELADLESRFPGDRVNLVPQVQHFEYPVLRYPTKVKALSLDTQPEIEGLLEGIKGQYLLLDTGVFNVRKHTSYDIELEVGA